MWCHSACTYAVAGSRSRARPASSSRSRRHRLNPIEQARHPSVIGQHDGNRAAIARQPRPLLQRDKQRVLLAGVMEVARVAAEEPQERRGVLRAPRARRHGQVREERARHGVDQVVLRREVRR